MVERTKNYRSHVRRELEINFRKKTMCDYNCVKTLIIIIIISLIRTNAALTIIYMSQHTQ